jgi:CO/xanthine dehydrogenase Mo-binding subunit
VFAQVLKNAFFQPVARLPRPAPADEADMSAALDVDGLVAVYTYDDLPDRIAEPLPLLIPHQALTEPRTAYCLANEVVRHVGEPVAMVVATDRYIAEDAAERIDVTYEPLPPLVGVDGAATGDRRVHAVPRHVRAARVQDGLL